MTVASTRLPSAGSEATALATQAAPRERASGSEGAGEAMMRNRNLLASAIGTAAPSRRGSVRSGAADMRVRARALVVKPRACYN